MSKFKTREQLKKNSSTIGLPGGIEPTSLQYCTLDCTSSFLVPGALHRPETFGPSSCDEILKIPRVNEHDGQWGERGSRLVDCQLNPLLEQSCGKCVW